MYNDYKNLLDKIKEVESLIAVGFHGVQTKDEFDNGIVNLIDQYDDNPAMVKSIFLGGLMDEIMKYYDEL